MNRVPSSGLAVTEYLNLEENLSELNLDEGYNRVGWEAVAIPIMQSDYMQFSP